MYALPARCTVTVTLVPETRNPRLEWHCLPSQGFPSYPFIDQPDKEGGIGKTLRIYCPEVESGPYELQKGALTVSPRRRYSLFAIRKKKRTWASYINWTIGLKVCEPNNGRLDIAAGGEERRIICQGTTK